MSCPTPDKATYPDAAAATLAAVHIRLDQHGPALIPYRCPCGSHHLKSADNLAARIRASLKETP